MTIWEKPVRVMHCGFCGKSGHAITTCPARKTADAKLRNRPPPGKVVGQRCVCGNWVPSFSQECIRCHRPFGAKLGEAAGAFAIGTTKSGWRMGNRKTGHLKPEEWSGWDGWPASTGCYWNSLTLA